MDLYKETIFTKSFYMYGKSLKKCFNCDYCRLIGEKNKEVISLNIPSDINPIFTNLPVAVNLFYGDPLLQIENTIEYLKKLEKAKHKAPVIVITKGDFSKFPIIMDFDLDLHFAFSTFGIDSKYDGGNLETFINNLELVSKTKYKYSIEFRPLIKGVNDSREVIENIFEIASRFNVPIGFCGLQVNDDLKTYFSQMGIDFKQYSGYEFGLKKVVSREVENIFYELSEKYNIHTFRKTSCLISYSHGMERDYNAHYYRPNEMRCGKCIMKDKCLEFKKKHDESDDVNVDIPFEYEIIHKNKHVCILHKKGICKYANSDCMNITGKVIKINQKITSSDLRVIKWLYGYTVDCDFDEIEFISKNWLK